MKYLYISLSFALLLFSFSGFAQPVFNGGHSQSITACENAVGISTNLLLSVSDAHTGTTDTWSQVTAPTHGAISVAYSTTSTGGVLIPAGTTYTPAFGYTGTDSFKVMVTDGTTADTTTIHVTVNPLPFAGTLTGPSAVCVGASITLTDATTGGTWSRTNNSAIVTGGIVTGFTAGTDTIIYSVTNSCGTATTNATVTVNAAPSAITGSKNLCLGLSSAFSDAVSGGTWSSTPVTVAAIGSSSGIATGMTIGTATIFYALASGCVATVTATVHALPAAISGASSVCKNASTVFLDGTPGGTWSSSDVTVASVGTGVGLVTGTGVGSATITYNVTGCTATKSITVNPASPITGPLTVCTAASIALSDTLGGGAWSSGNTAIATVVAGSGLVTGIAPGTATITYTLAGTGCAVTITESVNLSPAGITGGFNACYGVTTTFADATSGGVWSSDNTAIATIGSSTGVVSGIALGTADITYTWPFDGCIAAETITVNALPDTFKVGGIGAYCSGTPGADIYLDSSVAGVNYFLHLGGSIAGIAAGTDTLLDFGPQPLTGTYKVTATNTATGCSALMLDSVVVSIIPSIIPTVTITPGSGDTVCAGVVTTYTAIPVNGGAAPLYQWQVNGLTVGIDTDNYSYGPANGDTLTVTMISNAVCAIPDTVTDTVIIKVAVHQTPSVTLTANPGDTVCFGNVITLTPVPVYGGVSPAYSYYKGGSLIGTGAHLAYIPSGGDTVYCYMISDYFCTTTDTAIAKIGITVDTPIFPSFVIVANPPVLTGPGQSDTLTVMLADTSGSFLYQWAVNDSIIHGATSKTYISDSFNYLGNDSVSCNVISLGVCSFTTFNWTFMQNNVGVKQLTAAAINVSVAPNPGKGDLTVKGTLGTAADQQVTIEITDMMGRNVYTRTATATSGVINEKIQLRNTIAGGMYLLTVRAEAANKVFHIVVEQ